MLCKNPFMGGAVPYGCGQCLPCRINKRRQWMWRQFFEALSHEHNCFVTLTYDDEHLPDNGSLRPVDLSLWLKRFRKIISPVRVRFFAVGEYGDRSQRPHYHLSMFGVSGHTDFIGTKAQHFGCSQQVQETWNLGNSYCAEFNEKTAQYVAGYTTKKLTNAGDARLNGRTPEFMRSSRRPGLGVAAMQTIATQLISGPGQKFLATSGDVPHTLQLGKKQIPLGRFLLQKLRKEVGLTDDQIALAKGKISMERSLEMLALFQNSVTTEEVPTFKKTHIKEVAQRVLQAETRYKIWSEKKERL